MDKRSTQSGKSSIVIILLIAVVAAGIWWMSRPPVVETPPPPPAQKPAPVVTEAPKPTPPPAPVVEKAPEQAPPAPAAAVPEKPEEEQLNARTLSGTKWKPTIKSAPDDGTKSEWAPKNPPQVEIEFAEDGQWKVNGEAKAQWVVEGNKIKVFDDKGEEHFIDIAGKTLVFDGKPIEQVK